MMAFNRVPPRKVASWKTRLALVWKIISGASVVVMAIYTFGTSQGVASTKQAAQLERMEAEIAELSGKITGNTARLDRTDDIIHSIDSKLGYIQGRVDMLVTQDRRRGR